MHDLFVIISNTDVVFIYFPYSGLVILWAAFKIFSVPQLFCTGIQTHPVIFVTYLAFKTFSCLKDLR